MSRRLAAALTLLVSLLCVMPVLAANLSPQARRDLSVLATVYPGAMTAIEVAPDGRVTVVFEDGSRIPYDDHRVRNDDQALADPDIKTMLAQPYPLGEVVSEPRLGFSPGRCRVTAFFQALYGHTQAEVRTNCRPIPFLGQTMAFNTRFGAAVAFSRATASLSRLLAGDPGLRRYLLPASGGLVWRFIACTNRLSAHSFAIAVDVSPRGNPYWRNLPRGTNILGIRRGFPLAIVEAFEREGFIWGGKWAEFDLMHFEYRPEMILLARLARGESVMLSSIDGLVRPTR